MGFLCKNLPWTRSETSRCAASKCPSRLEVFRPLMTCGQCRHRLLNTSSFFSFLMENISNSSRTGAHFRRGGFKPLALSFFLGTFLFGGISVVVETVVCTSLSSRPAGRSRTGHGGATCPGCWIHRPPQAWAARGPCWCW